MTERWDDYFMDLAMRSGQMSYCNRLRVGATAVKDNRPILSSWNGTPSGTNNCCEEDNATKLDVSHAEENLITWAAKEGISLHNTSLYITHSPCIYCAKLIKNAGIIEVIWKDTYRESLGLEYLNKYEVKTRQYNRGKDENQFLLF